MKYGIAFDIDGCGCVSDQENSDGFLEDGLDGCNLSIKNDGEDGNKGDNVDDNKGDNVDIVDIEHVDDNVDNIDKGDNEDGNVDNIALDGSDSLSVRTILSDGMDSLMLDDMKFHDGNLSQLVSERLDGSISVYDGYGDEMSYMSDGASANSVNSIDSGYRSIIDDRRYDYGDYKMFCKYCFETITNQNDCVKSVLWNGEGCDIVLFCNTDCVDRFNWKKFKCKKRRRSSRKSRSISRQRV